MGRTVQAVDLTDYECETIRHALIVLWTKAEIELSMSTLSWDKNKMAEMETIIDRAKSVMDRIPT